MTSPLRELLQVLRELPDVAVAVCVRPVVRYATLVMGTCASSPELRAFPDSEGRPVHTVAGMDSPTDAAVAYHLSEGGRHCLGSVHAGPGVLLPPGAGPHPIRAAGFYGDDTHTLLWLALLGPRAIPPEILADAEALVAPVVEAIRSEHTTATATLQRTGALLLDDDGAVAGSDPATTAWLATRRAGLDDPWEEGTAVLPGALARVQGVGDAGAVRRVVTVHPARAPLLPVGLGLTPTQRIIAPYLAAGASTPEVARHLDRSPATVHSHAKAIYARLGVGSRVELVERLSRI